jgi:hypothetical protein
VNGEFVVFDSGHINSALSSSDVDGEFQRSASLLLFNQVILKFGLGLSLGGQTVLLLDLSFGQSASGVGDFLVSE